MIVKPLVCSCCSTPVGKLVKDTKGVVRLVLVARHHSRPHVNSYTREELQQFLQSFDAEPVDKPIENVLP